MKFKIITLSLLFSAIGYSQRASDQYSVEAGYGLAISGEPSMSEFTHFEGGFRYMADESWGLKFDFGYASFRPDTEAPGTNYTRISAQGVNNLGRTLNIPALTNNSIGLLAHGGLGLSTLVNPEVSGSDKIGNVILGLTPQLQIAESLALKLDTSIIFNFTQHYNFDGNYPNEGGTLKSFTGRLFTASFGLTYYFGKNGSKSDWR